MPSWRSAVPGVMMMATVFDGMNDVLFTALLGAVEVVYTPKGGGSGVSVLVLPSTRGKFMDEDDHASLLEGVTLLVRVSECLEKLGRRAGLEDRLVYDGKTWVVWRETERSDEFAQELECVLEEKVAAYADGGDRLRRRG